MDAALELNFSKDVFQNTFGFGMDFGGSVIKLAYTSEEDDKIRVHFVTFPREKHEEAFSILVEKCSGRLEPGTEVLTCGVGGSEFQDELSQRLGFRFANTNEFDRLLEGFIFLSRHLAWSDFVQPVRQDVIERSGQRAMMMSPIITALKAGGRARFPPQREVAHFKDTGGKLKPAANSFVEFPTLLCIVGSAAVCIKAFEDGSSESYDMSTVAGRTCQGLGSLFTDATSFSELCDMAAKGDPTKVDVYTDSLNTDVKSSNKDDQFYQAFKEVAPYKAFAFGHAVGKTLADFEPGDISNAFLSLISDIIANNAYALAILHNIKQVFFIGGFPCASPFIQNEIGKKFMDRRFLSPSVYHPCDCYFVKHGQHCGSFGSLITNLKENEIQNAHS